MEITMSNSTETLRARIGLESLEDRLAPAYLSGGDIVIVGTAGNDTVSVNYYYAGGVTYYHVTQNGVSQYFNSALVYGGDVYFYGYAGNDYFINNTYLRTTAYGMDGNDTLYGGYSNDYLDGGN